MNRLSLQTLSQYLPPPANALPVPSVSVASLKERAVGIGRSRGGDSAGPFGAIALKGIRLDAVARFQLWAGGPNDADNAISHLNAQLMADRENLRTGGFLNFAGEAAPPAEPLPPPVGAWRKYADYRVLCEFDYQDTDDAQGLIARIPVSIDSELAQSMTTTDELARWDNHSAPSLVVRGTTAIGALSLLAFGPTPPTAPVTLTRTYDGAVGAPAAYATLAKFLAAVSGESPFERHAKVIFPSFGKFLDAFTGASAPIALGDWDNDGIPDQYQPLDLPIDPAIQLPKISDRFEVACKANGRRENRCARRLNPNVPDMWHAGVPNHWRKSHRKEFVKPRCLPG
jgi:hypothetical protein